MRFEVSKALGSETLVWFHVEQLLNQIARNLREWIGVRNCLVKIQNLSYTIINGDENEMKLKETTPSMRATWM